MLAHGVSSVEDGVDRGRRATPWKYPGLNISMNVKGGDTEKNIPYSVSPGAGAGSQPGGHNTGGGSYPYG